MPTVGLLLAACSLAAEVAPPPRPAGPPKMPLTGLAPSKVVADLCVYRYPVSTRSAECQAFCDQGAGYYYSYVWMEAARCFETALSHDPECAFAWLGLHRSVEKWGKGTTAPAAAPFLAAGGAAWQGRLPDRFGKSAKDFALEQARRLMPAAGPREQLLIRAKLEEKGMLPNVKPEDRAKKAAATLDELLMLHDDDEEGWYARAQVAVGGNAKAVFYKALLRFNPDHPGANHELVHFYENVRRPALGWPFAEGYMRSSPNVPHAFHMQAHLGMRIGKWRDTTDWSARAYAMQKEYHARQGVKPAEDHQFRHHMETLLRALVHDGRFAEADRVKTDAAGYKYEFRPEFFRLALVRGDWAAARTIADASKKDKVQAAYLHALLALEQGDTARATAAVDVLRQAGQGKRTRANKRAGLQLWETQGRLMCQTGQAEAGCKLLKRAVDQTKGDFAYHAWGGGAGSMETWGIAALEGGLAQDAEEAFEEALAHDAGSVRGALGMWALCAKLGRTEEADRFLKLARRCWAKADPKDFERLKEGFARKADHLPAKTLAATGGE